MYYVKYSYLMVYLIIWQRTNKFTVAGNHEYKETDNINSVKSSLKSHLLWVTLYIFNVWSIYGYGYIYIYVFSEYIDMYIYMFSQYMVLYIYV